HVFVGSRVNVRERFQISFRVAAGNPARAAGHVLQIGRVRIARVNPVRLAIGEEEHFVRLLLMPFERALRAINFDPEVVLPAVGYLRGRYRAEGSVGVADRGRAVVVELSPGLERLEQAGKLVGDQAGDEAAEVVGVGADVAEAAGRARTLRV